MLIPILMLVTCAAPPPTQNADQVLSERMSRQEDSTDEMRDAVDTLSHTINDQRFEDIEDKLDVLISLSLENKAGIVTAQEKSNSTVMQQTGMAGGGLVAVIAAAYGGKRYGGGNGKGE